MTEYEIQRTAKAVVNLLLDDDRFLRRMERIASRRGRMLNTSQAASLLGISQWTLRDIAPYLGGVKKGGDDANNGQRAKWAFSEDGLKERYLEYINSKQE